MRRQITACVVLFAALSSTAWAQTTPATRPDNPKVQALLSALPPYQAAAEQAMEKIKTAIAGTKDAKALTALYNAQLRAEMILSVPAFAEKAPAHFTVSMDTLKSWQEAVDYFLAAAKEGKDGFEGMTSGVRALRSPIDGQVLFYKFRLPADYSADKKYPLDVGLHSGGGLVWRAAWVDGKPSNDPRNANKEQTIWISPCGRGNNSYAGPAQVALIQEIEDAIAIYSVDPDRVYSGGASMGGTGSFRVGSLNPHLLAGIESLTGGGAYGYGRKTRFDSYELVDNFANVAVLIFDATNEGHFKDNHKFVEDMKALEQKHPGFYKVNEVTDPKGSHGIIDKAMQPAGRKWLQEQKRNLWPALVVYKTPNLRHNQAYWVRIDLFENPSATARIEAERGKDNQIRILTENLARFELNLDPQLIGDAKTVSVAIDGQTALSAPAGRVAFARAKDQWAIADKELPAGLLKRHGMSGPMMDVFMEHPVLFVYGTGKEKDAAAGQAAVDAGVLGLWGEPDGGSMLHTMFDRKADSAVTDQDIAASNLVLLGSPATNAIIQRIADKLPAKFGEGTIELGGKKLKGELFLCYPNPLNPQRYVMIVPSSWTRPAYGIYNWGDWMVMDGKRVTGQGSFDAHWAAP